MYQNSIESLTAVQRKDLRRVMGLKAIFPNLRIVNGPCNNSRAIIEFSQSGVKPRLDLQLASGEYLNDPKFGLWPVESATYQLRKITFSHGGYDDPWPYGYTWGGPDENDESYFLIQESEVDGEAFFRGVFADVREVNLRNCATKISHVRTIVEVARNITSLHIIVAKGPRQSKDETKQLLRDTMIKLGHLKRLKHLALFLRNDKIAGFPQLQTLPWKALETLECNVSPDRILKQRYGHSCKPPQLLSRPQSPPSGTLRKVVIHLDGQIYEPPNPVFFAYALLEMFPSSVEISCNVAEASSFEGGHKCWDYQSGFDTLAFGKWVEQAHKSMRGEMTASLDATQKSHCGESPQSDQPDDANESDACHRAGEETDDDYESDY